MKRLLIIDVLFVCLVLSVQAYAQQTSNATVGGTVSDATGALIPGVTITITNTGTGTGIVSANRKFTIGARLNF